MQAIWNAVLNEPFTVIGFIGVAIAWWWRMAVENRQREAGEQQRDELRSLEIADVMAEANLFCDRSEVKQKDLSRQAETILVASLPENDEILEKLRKDHAERAIYVRKLKDFNFSDSSHENLLAAKSLLLYYKRLDKFADTVAEKYAENSI